MRVLGFRVQRRGACILEPCEGGDFGLAVFVEQTAGFAKMLTLSRERDLPFDAGVIPTHGLRDLREIADTPGGHDGPRVRGGAYIGHREGAVAPADKSALPQDFEEAVVERGHAIVVEPRSDGAVDGHGFDRCRERLAVALHLLAHVAQRVLGPLAVELVDGDERREIEHVDLLELARGAELRGHHVDRHVHEWNDARVALADAARLDDHDVEARDTGRGDDVRESGGHLAARHPGREGAHVDVRVADCVHPDAIAEQRPAGLASRRVDREHRDAQRVAPVEAQATHEFVGERRLAGAAGAGDADDGRRCHCRRPLSNPRQEGRIEIAVLDRGDHPRERAVVAGFESVETDWRNAARTRVAPRDHVVDHAAQAQGTAVLGGVDPGDAMRVQLAHLLGNDHAAAAPEHADPGAAPLAEHVHHVLEVLDVPALVGAHRDRMGVLVERGDDDLFHRAVVSEMDDFGARRLEDPAHDVDGRVVSVEQACRRDETDPCGGLDAALDGVGDPGAAIDKCGLGHDSGSSPDPCVAAQRRLVRGEARQPRRTREGTRAPPPAQCESAKVAG